MKYDFTTVLDRAGHDCLAADRIPFEGVQPDAGFDAIPMWVADMAFPTAPPILEAVRTRLSYKYWYFGHYHRDLQINERDTMLHKKITKIR